jgi:hypothetical protein
MKKRVVRFLLAVLNSRWLNQTPCEYGFINNVEAFSYANLRSELISRPDLKVSQVLAEADAFKSCPLKTNGLTVIEDGIAREGTIWDVHQLRQELAAGGASSQETGK